MVHGRLIKNIGISFLLLSSLNASASYLCSQSYLPQYLFGLEFTITNEIIVREGNANPASGGWYGNPIKEDHWKKLVERIKQECKKSKECKTSMTEDKHDSALQVTFKDGFYFTIGSDSAALEANAQPQTSEGYKKVLQRMEKYLFALAREVNLTPHERAGGGHIHIARGAFEENPLAFRNFLVDFQNRPELVYGALGNHLGNSAPLAALKPSQRDAFTEVVRDFNPETKNINDLIDLLHSKVFTEGYIESWGSPNYYQAFNMTRMKKTPDRATLEIRSFRPQENTRAFQLQVYLLETWVNKIKNLDSPLPYIRKDRFNYTPQEIVDSYAQLLEELTLPWSDFSVLLPPALRNLQPKNQYQSVPYHYNSP